MWLKLQEDSTDGIGDKQNRLCGVSISRRKVLFTKTLLIFFVAGIPSPIYFGALIDTTCLKWGTMTCGGEGACRMYDIVTYRYIFYFIFIFPSYSVIACIRDVLVCTLSSWQTNCPCVRDMTQFSLALALFIKCNLWHRCWKNLWTEVFWCHNIH